MLINELGRRNLGKTLYTWGQVGKIPISVSTIMVSCPLPTLIKAIHDVETSKPDMVPMHNEVYIGPSHEVKI